MDTQGTSYCSSAYDIVNYTIYMIYLQNTYDPKAPLSVDIAIEYIWSNLSNNSICMVKQMPLL